MDFISYGKTRPVGDFVGSPFAEGMGTLDADRCTKMRHDGTASVVKSISSHPGIGHGWAQNVKDLPGYGRNMAGQKTHAAFQGQTNTSHWKIQEYSVWCELNVTHAFCNCLPGWLMLIGSYHWGKSELPTDIVGLFVTTKHFQRWLVAAIPTQMFLSGFKINIASGFRQHHPKVWSKQLRVSMVVPKNEGFLPIGTLVAPRVMDSSQSSKIGKWNNSYHVYLMTASSSCSQFIPRWILGWQIFL